MSHHTSPQQRLFLRKMFVFGFKMASALWAELRAMGLQDLAPTLFAKGVRSVDDVRRNNKPSHFGRCDRCGPDAA